MEQLLYLDERAARARRCERKAISSAEKDGLCLPYVCLENATSSDVITKQWQELHALPAISATSIAADAGEGASSGYTPLDLRA